MKKIPKTIQSLFGRLDFQGKGMLQNPSQPSKGISQAVSSIRIFSLPAARSEFRMIASTSTIFGRFGAEPSGSWKGCLYGHARDMGVISTAPL